MLARVHTIDKEYVYGAHTLFNGQTEREKERENIYF
jgi:hypothetical protein